MKIVFIVLLFSLLGFCNYSLSIKVALLAPLTGNDPSFGLSIVEAQKISIDLLNSNNSLSESIKYVEVDTRASSLNETFLKYWNDNSVNEIFFTGTSNERQSITQLISRNQTQTEKQVWFSLPYEGQECSRSLWYYGGNPNSQVHTCFPWALEQSNYQILLVGLKESVYSINILSSIQSYCDIFGIKIQTLFLPSDNYNETLKDEIKSFSEQIPSSTTLISKRPSFVLNTLNDASPSMIRDLYTTTAQYSNLRVLSFMDSSSFGLGSLQTERHLDCVPYWKGSSLLENEKFIEAFLQKHPEMTRWDVSSEQEMAYSSVLAWSQKFKSNGKINSLYNMRITTPEGEVVLLPSHQVKRKFYIVSGSSDQDQSFSNQIVHQFPLNSAQRSQPWDRYIVESREYTCNWTTQVENPGHQIMKTVRVGVLHSSTGSLAISEQSLIRADILAIDQINDQGGVNNGHYVLPIFRDGASVPSIFAEEAEKLIVEDKVTCIFGCWTSSSRQAVAPVVGQYETQLYYPVQYEGSECDKHVFYGGATPNQQLEPAIHWALYHLSTMFFLAGSDYVYPRTSNKIAKEYIKTFGGQVYGEEYVPLDDTTPIPQLLEKIVSALPNGGCILNTLNGDGNVEFFRQLSNYNITPEKYPIISFSITEQEASQIGFEYLTDHYASWNYFMSIDTPENQEFIQLFRYTYGSNVITNDPMEASWILVQLWRQAVSTAKSFDPDVIRRAIYGEEYNAPENPVVMNTNHHLSKWARIGKLKSDGQFELVLQQSKRTYPEPWNQYLTDEVGYECDFFDERNHGSRYLAPQVWIGVLHSLTGTLSFSERPIVDTYLMAIEAINEAGGVNGKRVIPKIANGESDWPLFETLARELTSDDDIVTVFGCWTSASRKQVLNVFRESLKTLWYPVQYEGQECERQVFYGGAAPNQQIEPAVDWWLRRGCVDLYLVGSDYVFPRTANGIIKAYCESYGCKVHGEDYIPLGDQTVSPILNQIITNHPNGICIFNTLNGDSNIALFKMMHDLGMGPDKYPTMSVSIGEPETLDIGPSYLVGHYAAWNYFQSVGNGPNDKKPNPSYDFVEAFKGKYGQDRVVSDPMEAAYILFNIWKQAAELSGSFDDVSVRKAAHFQGFDAPEGLVTMGSNHHLTKVVRIGQVNQEGQFDVLFERSGVTAIPWNQNIPETTGFVCDHSHDDDPVNPVNGTLYQPPQVKIGIIHSLSGSLSSPIQRSYVDGYEIAISEWNKLGGVSSKLLVPIIKNDESDIDRFEEIVKELVSQGVVAIFGGSSQEAVDRVSEFLHERSIPFFTPIAYSVSPKKCYSSVFYSSLTPEQELSPTIDTFRNRSKSMFFLIGLNDEATNIRVEVVTKIIERNPDLTFGGYYLIDSSLEDSQILEKFRSWWNEITVISSSTNGAVILNYFTTESGINPLVFESFSSIGLSKSRFPIVSFRMSVPEVSEISLQFVEEHLLVSNYFSGLDTLVSQTFDQKMLGESYVKSINHVPNEGQNAYTLLHLWASGSELAGSFDLDPMRYAMYRRIISTPPGNVFMEINNRVASAYYLASVGKYLSARVIYPPAGQILITSLINNTFPDLDGEFGIGHTLESVMTLLSSQVLNCNFGPEEVMVEYSSSVTTTIFFFTGVGFFLILLTAIGIIFYRNHRVVIASSIPFLFPILLGISGGFVAGILFASEPGDDNGVCLARIWVFILSGMWTLSFLLIKNWRLYQIFHNALHVKSKTAISNKILFLEVGSILILQLIILIVWTSIEPSEFVKTFTTDKRVDHNFDGEIEYIPHCTVSETFIVIQFLFSGILLVAGTFLSWSLRDLPTNFNESKYIGFAIFLIVFFCIILTPVNFLLNTDSSDSGSTNSLVVIRGLGVTFASTIILLVLFVPKLMMILLRTTSGSTNASGMKNTRTTRTEVEAI